MRQNSFGEIVADVEVERLVNTLQRWRPTLAEKFAEMKAGNVAEALTALKAASAVVTLAPTLAERKLETAGKTLSDVEIKTKHLGTHLVIWIPRNYCTRWMTRLLRCTLRNLQKHYVMLKPWHSSTDLLSC